THCGLGHADRAGLAGLQRNPATGPSVPPHTWPANSREQRHDSNPYSGSGVGLVCPCGSDPIRRGGSTDHADVWCPTPSPATLCCTGARLLVVCSALSLKKREGHSDPWNMGCSTVRQHFFQYVLL